MNEPYLQSHVELETIIYLAFRWGFEWWFVLDYGSTQVQHPNQAIVLLKPMPRLIERAVQHVLWYLFGQLIQVDNAVLLEYIKKNVNIFSIFMLKKPKTKQ